MAVDMQLIGKQAKTAALNLRRFTTAQKNAALYTIADALETHSERILQANALDLDDARTNGLSAAMLDRLSLVGRLPSIAADMRHVATLPDPVGVEFDARVLENGLRIRRRRVPLGVLGVIYEARPNVTVDVVALALKTSNAVILRGGSETLRSNVALADIIEETLDAIDFPPFVVQLIRDSDRQYVRDLLRLDEYVDMIIPRGGATLHKFCRENSTVPVITGGIGICHLYVDRTADLNKAVEVIYNAKVQRPSVCNALDTILVQRDIAADLVPRVIDRLAQANVCFKVDEEAAKFADGKPNVEPAGPGDWDTEWLSLILGVHVVSGLDEALEHINEHSTDHSDGILSADPTAIERFLNEVDSAAVYANASTRFTDGSQFGLGAEIAVSTQKLHARGPMGLEELTSYKWIVEGDGHVRA
jgi:glutamate-5-semialdehyde dehydrogenase